MFSWICFIRVDQVEHCSDARCALPSSTAEDPTGATASVVSAAAAAGCTAAWAGTPSDNTVWWRTVGVQWRRQCVQLSDAEHDGHPPAAAAAAATAAACVVLRDDHRSAHAQLDGSRGDPRRLYATDEQRTLRRYRIHLRTTTSLGPQGRSSTL